MAKILVVDDIEDNRKLLELDLQDDDHEVLLAGSGEEALEIAVAQQPDLMLLDQNMPGMSGNQVLRKMRDDEQLKEIPVIVVTANDLDDEVIEALDLGANDYVTKPYSYPVLSARMRTSLRLKRSQDSLRRANKRLEIMATTDALTGLYNRRHFLELAGKELAKAKRFERSLTVAMIDIDHFKKINDEHGHDVGDRVLVEISKRFKAAFRETDIIGRLGGEEFGVCMSDTDHEGAFTSVERVRKAICGEAFLISRFRPQENLDVTASIGYSTYAETDKDVAAILRRADHALYKAKRDGRNRAVEAKPEE